MKKGCKEDVHNWDKIGDSCISCGIHYLTFLGVFNASLSKCECGACKTEFPDWHADYCPKYVKEIK